MFASGPKNVRDGLEVFVIGIVSDLVCCWVQHQILRIHIISLSWIVLLLPRNLHSEWMGMFFLSAAPGISASPSEENMRYFNVMILGPSQSPYEGNKLNIFIPNNFASCFGPFGQFSDVTKYVQITINKFIVFSSGNMLNVWPSAISTAYPLVTVCIVEKELDVYTFYCFIWVNEKKLKLHVSCNIGSRFRFSCVLDIVFLLSKFCFSFQVFLRIFLAKEEPPAFECV